MTMATVAAMRLLNAFELGSHSAFNEFLEHNVGQRNWVLASDYNWRDCSRPQNVLAFTLYPDHLNLRGLVSDLQYPFPADFKKIKALTQEAIDWFKIGNAFHFCVILDNHGSFLKRPDRRRRDLARESIRKTRLHLERFEAPTWIQKRFRIFESFSQSANFNANLYDDILFLSIIYAVIVGLIARAGRMERVLWCSDRDDRINWAQGILDTFGLINACQWAGQYGQRFDAANLPSLRLRKEGPEPFDALIRPPDYLAGSLSSWDLSRGEPTQQTNKYRQMLREAVAENPKIAVLHLKIDDLIDASQVRVVRC